MVVWPEQCRRVVARQQAAAALAKLASNNEETSSTITQLGGITPLIALLTESSVTDAGEAKGEKVPAHHDNRSQ